MKPSKIIGSVATPIARAFNMDCIDPETNQLRPDSNCAKRGNRIDQWTESVYNFFVKPETRKKGENMKYKVQLLMIVDAENTLSVTDQFKTLKGEVVSIGIGPVPSATPQPQQPVSRPPLAQPGQTR